MFEGTTGLCVASDGKQSNFRKTIATGIGRKTEDSQIGSSLPPKAIDR